jgi:Uma2 family endonuclease
MLFPYSPTLEEWRSLSAAQREAYKDSIPQDPVFDASAPEGDVHDWTVTEAREALEQFFRRKGRHVYLARNRRVLYPGEDAFDPDLLAVLDVEPTAAPRSAWIVAEEGRGIDFALEVYVFGSRNKDAITNVKRYARLGVPEYFFFDRPARRLHGWKLGSPGARSYTTLIPQAGRLHSDILDLELGLVEGRLRFFSGSAELPTATELLGRLEEHTRKLEEDWAEKDRLYEEALQRAQAESERAQAESKRAQAESERAQEAERRLAEATAELERLRAKKD